MKARSPVINHIALWLSLLVIITMGTYFRLWTIAEESLWYDEAVSWSQSRKGLSEVLQTTAADNYPPLHNLLLFTVVHTIGDSETALRLPSAVLGVANIIAIYWLGTLLNNPMAGLLAALLLALSKFHIWYSQEARMYALFALCATLFAATSVRLSRDPNRSNSLITAVAGVALLYSHPFGTPTWAAIAIGILINLMLFETQISARKWILLQGMIGASFLPWGFVLVTRAKAIMDEGFWIPELSVDSVGKQFTDLASGSQLLIVLCAGASAALLRAKATSMILSTPRASLPALTAKLGLVLNSLFGPFLLGIKTSLLLLVPLVPVATHGSESSRQSAFRAYGQMTPAVTLLFTWLVLPTLFAFVVSATLQPLFLARYLLSILPAWLLLASIGILRMQRTISGFGLTVTLLLGISINSVMGWSVTTRQDWRAVSAFLTENKNTQDCVIIYKSVMLTPLQYYYRQPISCLITPRHPSGMNFQMIPRRIWLIFAHELPAERKEVIKNLPAGPWRIEQKTFRGGITLVSLSR